MQSDGHPPVIQMAAATRAVASQQISVGPLEQVDAARRYLDQRRLLRCGNMLGKQELRDSLPFIALHISFVPEVFDS
jgi:hypothetical protein